MSNSFNVMSENPNLASGSNGCLCHELGGPDTKGPFVAFIGTETDNVHAPFPVLCAGCALEASQLVHYELSAAPQPSAPRRARKRDVDGPSI